MVLILHVHQEAAQELVGAERHGLDPHRAGGGIGGAVVLPAEADGAVVQADEPAVGDGDAVSVAGEVGEHRRRAAEGRLGVDHPLGPTKRRQVRGERIRCGKVREVAEEAEAPLSVRGDELLQEEAAEQPREHPNGQEEALAAGDPALAIRR
jgi:hypothetical protein